VVKNEPEEKRQRRRARDRAPAGVFTVTGPDRVPGQPLPKGGMAAKFDRSKMELERIAQVHTPSKKRGGKLQATDP